MTLLFLRLCLENKRALLRAFKGVHLVCLGPDPTEGDVSKEQGCICFHDLSKLCRPTLGGTQISMLSVCPMCCSNHPHATLIGFGSQFLGQAVKPAFTCLRY